MSTSKTWPGGATGATATAYTIPAAGEFNWASLSNFLIALADGAQATTFQKFAVRKATTSPVTVATTDCAIVTDLSVAGAVAVNLPAGANKQVFFIADGKGDASTNNVTITPNGAETIGGAASVTLTNNREGIILIFNSGDSDWKILGRTTGTGVLVNPMSAAGDMIYGGSSGVATRLAANATAGSFLLSGGAGAPTWSNIMSAAGDMIYGGASGLPTRLAAGTSGQLLVSGGAGAPTWTNTLTTGKFIDGSADEVQLRVQANATQTANIFAVENSGASVLMYVAPDGTLSAGPSSGTAAITHILRSNAAATLQLDANGSTGGIANFKANAKSGTATYAALDLSTGDVVKWSVLSGTTYTGTSGLSADELGVVRSGGGGTLALKLGTTGALTAPLIHNLNAGNITSGTYTPTLARSSGVAASFSQAAANYIRVGNIVHVSGRGLINNTSGSDGLLTLTVTLPVTSDLTAGGDLSGTAANSANGDLVPYAGIVQADTTNDKAEIRILTKSGADNPIKYTFSYEVK